MVPQSRTGRSNMTDQTIGVIGLGSLGSSMCRILLQDGFSVLGYDIDPERISAMVDEGVEPRTSAAAVASDCAIVLLSLPDSRASEVVCLGSDGILAADNPNLLVIETTSGYPDATLAIAAELAKQRMRMVDAAITGEVGGAIALPQRALTWCVGGADADVAEAQPLLERMSRYFFHVGPLGAGQIVKMVNNMAGAAAGIATMEGLLAAAKHGIDVKAAARVLDKGTGMNFFVRNADMMFADDGPRRGGFQIGLMTKDLRHMSKFAHESGVPSLMTDQAFHIFELFTRQVGYDADILSQAEIMQQWAGVTFSGKPVE